MDNVIIFLYCSIKMTGKIIRPAPAEIEFRNMRFLITDQPQVSPVTSTRPLIGQRPDLCPLIGQNVAIIVYRNARKEVSYLAHFVILDFGRKWVQKIIINPNKAFLYTINLDVTKSQNPLSLIQFMHFCCLQPFETLKQWFELNAFPGRDHGQLHQVAAGAQGLPPGLRHWPALQDRGARQKW